VRSCGSSGGFTVSRNIPDRSDRKKDRVPNIPKLLTKVSNLSNLSDLSDPAVPRARLKDWPWENPPDALEHAPCYVTLARAVPVRGNGLAPGCGTDCEQLCGRDRPCVFQLLVTSWLRRRSTTGRDPQRQAEVAEPRWIRSRLGRRQQIIDALRTTTSTGTSRGCAEKQTQNWLMPTHWRRGAERRLAG
jgi:hypothetical protein